MFAQDAESMDKVKDEIETEAKLKKIEIQEGTGPAFEAKIIKNIHEDLV